MTIVKILISAILIAIVTQPATYNPKIKRVDCCFSYD